MHLPMSFAQDWIYCSGLKNIGQVHKKRDGWKAACGQKTVTLLSVWMNSKLDSAVPLLLLCQAVPLLAVQGKNAFPYNIFSGWHIYTGQLHLWSKWMFSLIFPMLLSLILLRYCANSSLNFHSHSLLLQLWLSLGFPPGLHPFLYISFLYISFFVFPHQHFGSHCFSDLFLCSLSPYIPNFSLFITKLYMFMYIYAHSLPPPLVFSGYHLSSYNFLSLSSTCCIFLPSFPLYFIYFFII